jgi:hypothetical protein
MGQPGLWIGAEELRDRDGFGERGVGRGDEAEHRIGDGWEAPPTSGPGETGGW